MAAPLPRADQLPARPVASARATPPADRAKSATLHRYVAPRRVDLVDAWAESLQREPEARRINWKRIANAAIISVAVFAVVYFGLQLLRGVL